MKIHRPFLSVINSLSVLLAAISLPVSAQKYVWSNVSIGASGYITGVVTSPAERDLVYIRTDNGGAYRFDASTSTWLPLMDVLPYADRDLYGIESIAPDPANPSIVYAACGKYSLPTSPTGDILKSTDKGRSWQKANTGLKIGGDEDLRWAGERLAVDPANTSILYFGSRRDGLWRSENGSAAGSWLKMYSLPQQGTPGTGITFVAVDKRSASGGRSQKIYVGSYGVGVYLSSNAGQSWTLIWSDTKPMRCAIGVDGTAYLTSGNGTLGIYNGTLRIARPSGRTSLCAVATHPSDPKVILVGSWGWGIEEITRSVDGGVSWSAVRVTRGPTLSASFHDKNRFGSGMSALAIDPFSPNKVWMTEGLVVWRTDNIAASPSLWDIHVKGIEQTVVQELVSPQVGAPLLSALADVAGFRHVDLRFPPSVSFNEPFFQDATTGLDAAGLNPQLVVRVGGFDGVGRCAYSENNGATWTAVPAKPAGATYGQVAVSADGSAWVWASNGAGGMYRTVNKGATWQKASGGPASGDFSSRSICRIVADKVDPNLLYVNERSALYRSTDKGASWQRLGTALEHQDWRRCELQTVIGRRDELWRGVESRGLFRSVNRGESFTKIVGVSSVLSFGFGKAAPGKSYPSLYLLGQTTGSLGVYRSDDSGVSWVRIGGDSPTLGCFPGQVTGDMQVYGRVYVGTSGRGIFYGEIEGTPHPPVNVVLRPVHGVRTPGGAADGRFLVNGRKVTPHSLLRVPNVTTGPEATSLYSPLLER